MNLANHIIVFLVCWWLVLFIVLPFGVKSHYEEESDEDLEPGIEKGAPVKANIAKKMLITTGITFVIWLCFYAVMEFELISLR